MKIAVASLQQESNTLSPIPSYEQDFDRAYGEQMLEKIHISEMLDEACVTVIPTLYAHALPGGPVVKEDYLKFADSIVNGIPNDVDGVWLYLHGSMVVEEIGSGETYLLKKIREKIGYQIPISVGLDFHANNTDEICSLANVICGFRTAPHSDQIETEHRPMRLLLHCIKNKLLPQPQLARANVIVPGDCVITAQPPLSQIMERAGEIEKLPGMLCVQVFNGQPWVDAPYTGPSMVVTHKRDNALAMTYARVLAKLYYDKRHDFKFLVTALPPEEAIAEAVSAGEGPIFISDSGDNTTAGAAGDNAFLLNRLLSRGDGTKNILLAGIVDAEACDACYRSNLGDTLELTVGGSLSSSSEKATIRGVLSRRGDIIGYTGDNAGPTATLDCGNITVIITKNRTGFTNMRIFESVGIDVSRYKIVVVKLGYLFPELAEAAKKSILAFTPGGSAEHLKDMGLKNIRRPLYPLDDNFMDQ